MRPTTGRPTTALPKKPLSSLPHKHHAPPSNFSISESGSQTLKNITENNDIDQSASSSKEKFEFLDSVVNGEQKKNFENLIKEEADRIDMVNKQKANLKNINLIETDIEGLYDWKTLFNNSRPLSAYTRFGQSSNKNQNANISKTFQSSITEEPKISEIDLHIPEFSNKSLKHKQRVQSESKTPSQQYRPYTALYSIGNNNKNKNIQMTETLSDNPKSMYVTEYAHHQHKGPYLLFRTYSGYFNEDKPTQHRKKRLLSARIPFNPRKAKRIINKASRQSNIKEKNFRKVKKKDTLKLNKQNVIIAGSGRNAQPLLKSIYRQLHPEEQNNFDPRIKYYKNSAKPLGTDDGNIDYTLNTRSKHIDEFIQLRERNSKSKSIERERNNPENELYITVKNIKCSTYNQNDPVIEIFNKIQKDERLKTEEYDIDYEEQTLVDSSVGIGEHKIQARFKKENEIVNRNANIALRYTTQTTDNPLTTNRKDVSLNTTTNKEHHQLTEKIQIDATAPTVHSTVPTVPSSITTLQKNRPKTGIITSAINHKRPFSSISNTSTPYNTLNSNRPLTSINRQHQNTQTLTTVHSTKQTTDVTNMDNGFIPFKSLPLKTDTFIPNHTYQKINSHLKQRFDTSKNLNSQSNDKDSYFDFDRSAYKEIKQNYFNSDNIDEATNTIRQRPLTGFQNQAIQNKLAELSQNKKHNKKWIYHDPNHKLSYIYFNQFIDTTFKQEENKKKREGELTYFQPLNVFNKNASRFYSSSNNYNVIKKRKNEHDFIQTNDIYTKKDMAFTNENKMRVKSAKIQF